MRVAVVTHCFPVDDVGGGGVQIATYQLCRALQALPGIELVVVRPLSRRADLDKTRYHGIPVVPLLYRRWLSRPLAVLWDQPRQVRAALAAIQPDIVHVQDSSLLDGRLPFPSVFTLHGLVEVDARHGGRGLVSRARAFALRLTLGAARRRIRNVIAISPYSLAVLLPGPPRRVWSIPNAVGDAFFDVVPRPMQPTVFFAGHCTPLKNVQGLIRGFAGLAATYPTSELRLAGTGQDAPYGRACRCLAADLGLASRVRFLGPLDEAGIRAELGRASVLALASLQENAPMCIAEAMAAGVPVVASRLGGIPWMIEDGRCGCLIEQPRNPAAIAAALETTLAPDRRAAMSRAARQRAEIFRPDRVAEQTFAVYREILGWA